MNGWSKTKERGVKITIYVLQVDMNKQKYYITDLSGSLSRNIMDSMLFFNEFSAESYAGTVEHLIEEVTGLIATVRVLKPPVSGIIMRSVKRNDLKTGTWNA